MRRTRAGLTTAIIVMMLSACADDDSAKTLEAINVVDSSGLNDVMLTSADPNEAVTFFQRATAESPERLDLQRSLGQSLSRAGRATEATVIWKKVVTNPDAVNDDRIAYADALVRNGQWDEAEAELDTIPPTVETFKRYRLEAMIADSNKEWDRADSFYETAVGLTTRPGSVLNNWGYSKLSRGDHKGAERLFGEAITYDPDLFTAKNNIILARGAQKNYALPILDVSQTERAQLMHTMALTAIKQGDVEVGKGLLNQAIDTHPQHFEPAVSALRALEG